MAFGSSWTVGSLRGAKSRPAAAPVMTGKPRKKPCCGSNCSGCRFARAAHARRARKG